MALPEKPASPRELMHYGVKGMKWGVRRGGLGKRWKDVISEEGRAKQGRLERQNSGNTRGVVEKINRSAHIVVGGGKKRMQKRNAAEIQRIEQQRRRIAKGEATVRDMLSGLNSVSVLDLAFTRSQD